MTDEEKYKDKKWLTHQYLDLDHSIKEIAEMVNRHPSTIRSWMNKNNIQLKQKILRSPLQRVKKISKCRRHQLRPNHNIAYLKEKLETILWERYVKNEQKNFYFKVAHMRKWESINIDRFTGSLISRILNHEIDTVTLYKKTGKGHTFRTCFSKNIGGKENETTSRT